MHTNMFINLKLENERSDASDLLLKFYW